MLLPGARGRFHPWYLIWAQSRGREKGTNPQASIFAHFRSTNREGEDRRETRDFPTIQARERRATSLAAPSPVPANNARLRRQGGTACRLVLSSLPPPLSPSISFSSSHLGLVLHYLQVRRSSDQPIFGTFSVRPGITLPPGWTYQFRCRLRECWCPVFSEARQVTTNVHMTICHLSLGSRRAVESTDRTTA